MTATGLRNEKDETLELCDGSQLYLKIGTLSAKETINIQLILHQILGPVIIPLISDSDDLLKQLMNNPEKLYTLSKAIEDMWQHEDKIMKMISVFCRHTKFSKDGDTYSQLMPPGNASPLGFDSVFSGEMGAMYEFVMAHLKHSFRGFLEKLKSAKSVQEQLQDSQTDTSSTA